MSETPPADPASSEGEGGFDPRRTARGASLAISALTIGGFLGASAYGAASFVRGLDAGPLRSVLQSAGFVATALVLFALVRSAAGRAAKGDLAMAGLHLLILAFFLTGLALASR